MNIRSDNSKVRDHREIGLFVADHVDAMLAYWDKDLICRFANDAYKQWFGKGREEMVDKITMEELLGPLYVKNLPYINQALRGVPQKFEREITLPTGEKRNTIANYYPEIVDGVVLGFFVHVADITELKKADEYMRKYAALEAKNKEMEQFAYIASHDLREPLLTVTSYAKLMRKKYQGELDAEGDQYLAYMTQSADRMMELIQGLLNYSRIGKERILERVDCEVVVKDVISDLDTRIRESDARIEIGSLPAIDGYKAELHVLFQNLISNAIKFRDKDRSPVIRISAEKEKGRWLFKVADNGIGIDEKHLEKIFLIFQRLHDKGEVEGNGIGLAHCKKIVELHSGEIWAESIPGEGSTFSFTIGL
jgi:PAS domain S-box-containing protein